MDTGYVLDVVCVCVCLCVRSSNKIDFFRVESVVNLRVVCVSVFVRARARPKRISSSRASSFIPSNVHIHTRISWWPQAFHFITNLAVRCWGRPQKCVVVVYILYFFSCRTMQWHIIFFLSHFFFCLLQVSFFGIAGQPIINDPPRRWFLFVRPYG